MPEDNQEISFEECRNELLNYKFDEVLDYYEEDFGEENAEEIENKIISEIGEKNPNYHNLLEQKIIHLWYELVNKVIDNLSKHLTVLPNTIDSSDIIIELQNIKKRTKENRSNFNVLKQIYIQDIYEMKFRVKSRIQTVKNIQEEKIKDKNNDKIYALGLAVFMLFLGYVLSKFF